MSFKHYKGLAGDSGVVRYEAGEDYITVVFQGNKYYKYSYAKPGKKHVENMKALALNGQGLSTYISQNVQDNYEDKWDGV